MSHPLVRAAIDLLKLPRRHTPLMQSHYWDHVYKKLGRHEWQLEYSQLEQHTWCDAAESHGWLARRVRGHAAPLSQGTWAEACGGEEGAAEQKALILGCGHSTLGEEMHAAGWGSITSIDFSDVAIEAAKRRSPELEWRTMDATQLAKGFGAGEFDLVVDKGLLDSMHLAGEPVRAQTLPRAPPLQALAAGICACGTILAADEGTAHRRTR